MKAPEKAKTRAIFKAQLTPWFAWLVAFCAFWVTLNFQLNTWTELIEFWPISIAMALGSFVAGSSPMGGGTVGFPVLVLFFDYPATTGSIFGLMIQSVGMTSASIYILASKTKIERLLLFWSGGFALAGLIIGTFFIAPYFSDKTIKIIFSSVWMSFALLTFSKSKELCRFKENLPIAKDAALKMGLLIGLVGGITAAITGVGIDMMLFTVLVLRYRTDLRIAIPTSVILMAFTSVAGTALHLLIGDISYVAFHSWLAAAPVVIIGAPLGAVVVNRVSRQLALLFVAGLCVFQFIWTMYSISPTLLDLVFAFGNLTVASVAFAWLYRSGQANHKKEKSNTYRNAA